MHEHTDSILISLRVTAVQMATDIWMQGDLVVVINGIKPYSESDIVDVEALQKSMEQEGEYYIFSCCCGIPQCSSWEKPIQVKYAGDIIIWTDPNIDKTWHLERGRMEEELEAAREEASIFRVYFEEKSIEYVGFGCNP